MTPLAEAALHLLALVVLGVITYHLGQAMWMAWESILRRP